MSFRRSVLLVCAAVLVVPAGATAATRSQSATLTAAGQSLTLTPACPRGQRATGGGFDALPHPNLSFPAQFYESQKVGQRRWRVSVYQGGAVVHPVTAFVYCSKNAAKTRTKAAVTPIPLVAGLFSAEARCGNAGRAMAGGFLIPSPASGSTALLIDTFRSGKKSWLSRAAAQAGTATITSFAYCADADLPKARSGGATSSDMDSPTTAISSPCKRGTQAKAGGFSQNAFVVGPGVYAYPYESFRNGKGWQASALHIGTGSATLNSIAYCA